MARNLYFCGSIRGGIQDTELYGQIIANMKKFGTVLTEHVGDLSYTSKLENSMNDHQIWTTDMNWLRQSQAVVAEVTVTSMGVGYEIGVAELLGLPILCLFRLPEGVNDPGRRLSAMISGNQKVKMVYYHTLEEANKAVDEFLTSV